MKRVGYFMGIPVYTEPSVPPGYIYFINGNTPEVASIGIRSKWRRLKDIIKKLIWRKK